MNNLYKKIHQKLRSSNFGSCCLHFVTGQSLITLMFQTQQTKIQVLENEVNLGEFSDMKFSSESLVFFSFS